MQAPKEPDPSQLTPEEIQNVQLFIRNTPSVVNIANIGQQHYTRICAKRNRLANSQSHDDSNNV